MSQAGSSISDLKLSDLSTDKLAAAVELNSAEWLRIEGRLPWVELHDEGGALWIFAGDTWPRNSVAFARFTAATVSRRIGEILEKHLANKVACNWIVGPVSRPDDLGKHLRAHGFHCMIHCAGMACNLNLLTRALQPPRGVMISMVEQPPLLRPVTTERRKRMQEARQILTQLTPKQVWCFSATLDGVPVGETMLCAGAGVGGIYNVEVLEKFRRRGVGSALVHAALTQARKLGFHAAVLGATGMGQQIYSRLNFQEVCKLSFYKYGKMRQLGY